MTIRKADKEKDYDDIWEMFSRVIKTGDTYVFDPDTPKEALHKIWLADNMDTFVAVDDDGAIAGAQRVEEADRGLLHQLHLAAHAR